ncbi:MAG: exonuclease SbcCD subunit D [Mycobacteriales bacterium]
MRLLHTSDWHLGRSLHRCDLRAAQAGYLDHLVEVVRAERVDAVLVSGDVYDRAVPPVDAVELCESALVRLREAGARVVLISGNHDSARRLGFGSRLVEAAGVHLRTRVGDCAEPVLLADAHGDVALYGVPYLEPDAVRSQLPPDPFDPAAELPRGHGGVLGRGLACIRADLAARSTGRSVVLAHAWVTGGAASESERDVTVGGVAQVPASLFDGFTYSALGHLHGPQTLAAGLRYSGSPLAYSFSEASHVKGSWLVELDAAGLARVEHVPAPVPHRLSCVRGTLDELLASPVFEARRQDWLTVVYTDAARPDDVMERLSARFAHILVLKHEPDGVTSDGLTYGARIAGRTDVEVGATFVEHVRRSPLQDAERLLLEQAFQAGRLAAASA